VSPTHASMEEHAGQWMMEATNANVQMDTLETSVRLVSVMSGNNECLSTAVEKSSGLPTILEHKVVNLNTCMFLCYLNTSHQDKNIYWKK